MNRDLNRERNQTIDFAKGFALVFMIVQHLSVWVWSGYGKSISVAQQTPLYFVAISFSALSAPLFIFCAGCGADLFMRKYQDPIKIVKRGLVLLSIAYIMNLIISSWFSIASWYVIHLIGFGFLTVPILYKMSSRSRVGLFWALFVASVVLQGLLNTPFSIGSSRMGDMNQSLPFLRYAFVEGHFPIFPWLAFFVFGYNSAEDAINNRYKTLFVQGAVLLLCAAICAIGANATGSVGFQSLSGIPFVSRLFTIRVRFYPILAPAFFFLTGIIPFLLALFTYILRLPGPIAGYFVSIGRISLTAFISHVFIKQLLYATGTAGLLSKWPTIGVTLLLLAFYTVLEKLWRKSGYKYGFEWLLRKLS
ncbi:MAG: heparan-alpha-glucosaminide N-acetyltransferase domain-containing protein [Spirochaetes bacterium]|jgi:uncharacterized membrane protein|nr:heparan-alpha-glucosaminide N-acetyltransferase domain-containing protein [Spirochaetota bacterium]